MKHPIWKLFLHLAFCYGFALHNVHASPQSNEPEVRQLWQLLDYVAVDYAGAVQNGSVISEMEYKEMQEFSERARSQVIALPPHASHAALTSIVTRLQQAVARKDPPLRVSELARDANKLLLAAYPFPVAPRCTRRSARPATARPEPVTALSQRGLNRSQSRSPTGSGLGRAHSWHYTR